MARRIAYGPRLDLALRASVAIVPRSKLRPYVMIHRKRATSVVSKTEIAGDNSFVYGRQTAYTTDGDKIAMTVVSGGGGGGGGGGRPGGGAGGGWPR